MNRKSEVPDAVKQVAELGKARLETIISIGLIVLVLLWVLSHLIKRDWYGGFTEPSIIVLLLMAVALLLLPYLSEFTLPGGIRFAFRDLSQKVKNIHETQLVGEVVFNQGQTPPQTLFWIDKHHLKRQLLSDDTALLFMTTKGAIGLSEEAIAEFPTGPEIAAVSRNSFRHANGHLFAIVNDMIIYLPSWSLPVKYGLTTTNQMEEISPESFQTMEILR
jgi:hypothetical protein